MRSPLRAALARGSSVVLATLHAVEGGSPRPAGSQMLFASGDLYGFLSGGCIEGDLAAHALVTLQSGSPQRLVYGEGGPFADIRLVCGGRVEILLERIDRGDEAVRALLAATVARRPALWASDGVVRACCVDSFSECDGTRASVRTALTALLEAPDAACASVDGGGAVALRYEPVRRMVVVGQDPTALAIASIASSSGFETHLVRPKGPSEPPPLANVIYHRQEVAQAFSDIGLDRWTYVALATHAVETDEEALVAALPSQAAYVGVLGARRRLPDRLHRLRSRGLTQEALDRLHAPIGLDIGGKAPFEIAVSVLAEVMAESDRRRAHAGLVLKSQASAAA